jgi:thymidylate kinase
MIIALEGLSCAGKTALSNALQRKYPKFYSVVPEFVLPVPKVITTSFCQDNDLAKAQLAKQYNSAGKVALMDRSWLSTVVYEYAAHGYENESLSAWYESKCNDDTIPSPDQYIYLRLNAATALARARKIGRFNEKYAWYSAADLASSKYDELFQQSEIMILTTILDATKPFDRLLLDIHELATKGEIAT